jgi:hypothetical protein
VLLREAVGRDLFALAGRALDLAAAIILPKALAM